MSVLFSFLLEELATEGQLTIYMGLEDLSVPALFSFGGLRTRQLQS